MVFVRVENTPLAFAGQTASYGAGVLNVDTSRRMAEVENTPVTFNSQVKGFTSAGGNPAEYTPG